MVGLALKPGYGSFLSIGLVLASLVTSGASFALNVVIEPHKDANWCISAPGQPGMSSAKLDQCSRPRSRAAYTPWCAKYGSLCASRAGGSAFRENVLPD